MVDTTREFEQQLKEILDPGPENHENPRQEIAKNNKETIDNNLLLPQKKNTVGIVIRIISFIAAIILLISFGIQIAFR
jgi:hypothetical protein